LEIEKKVLSLYRKEEKENNPLLLLLSVYQNHILDIQSKRQNEQNMSPSTYQTLKQEYESLQTTHYKTKESLKKAREEMLCHNAEVQKL